MNTRAEQLREEITQAERRLAQMREQLHALELQALTDSISEQDARDTLLALLNRCEKATCWESSVEGGRYYAVTSTAPYEWNQFWKRRVYVTADNYGDLKPTEKEARVLRRYDMPWQIETQVGSNRHA